MWLPLESQALHRVSVCTCVCLSVCLHLCVCTLVCVCVFSHLHRTSAFSNQKKHL